MRELIDRELDKIIGKKNPGKWILSFDKNDKTVYLIIFDKNGEVHSRTELDSGDLAAMRDAASGILDEL